MNYHLNAKHSSIWKNRNNGKESQPKINTFTVPKVKKNKMDLELSILIASKCLPLSLGETCEFKRFMSAAVPGYDVPCAKTIKKNYIEPMIEKVRHKISEEAQDTKFALTCDLWSNLKQESFLGLTCHFISNSVKRNVVLECVPFQGAHNNDNIRKKVIN